MGNRVEDYRKLWITAECTETYGMVWNDVECCGGTQISGSCPPLVNSFGRTTDFGMKSLLVLDGRERTVTKSAQGAISLFCCPVKSSIVRPKGGIVPCPFYRA